MDPGFGESGVLHRARGCWVLMMWVIVVLPGFAEAGPAQELGQTNPVPSIRVQTNLVEVPVTVTDKKGNPILGLKANDFRIYEDGVEQTLHHFTGDSRTASWGLILDISGSMAPMMEEVYSAALHMIESTNSKSEAFIVVFSDEVRIPLPFTTDRTRMRRVIDGLSPGGSTTLWDAVTEGLDQMKKAKNSRKALVVITDGEDNHSRTLPGDLIDRVKESDVLVYSVAMLADFTDHLRPFWLFGGGSQIILRKFAEASGAYSHLPRSVKQCKEAMLRIASEMSCQYLLGYYPSDTTDPPRYRKLKVVVQKGPKAEHASVRARQGYFGLLGTNGNARPRGW